jgi:trk system potassium uptake protein TrkA
MSNGYAALYVVVVGCGRVGSHLAETLSRQGAGVVVVDHRPEAFAQLSGEFSGFTLEADASEFGSLRQAKADRADMVFACTDSDNVNILVAQAARDVLGARAVSARIHDPDKERLCAALRIPTVCPARVAGDIFLHALAEGRGKEAPAHA